VLLALVVAGWAIDPSLLQAQLRPHLMDVARQVFEEGVKIRWQGDV
jgi:hypothetical protein